jgi:type I restriction enzyme S subunit
MPTTRIATLKDLAGGKGIFVDGDWIESKDQDPAGDVRLIQMMDIGDGDYLNKSNRFLTSQKAKDLKCTQLQTGDVLISRMPDPLGRACIFPGDEKPCVTAVDVCIVRPDPRIADARWVKYRVNTQNFRSSISQWATGTTRERISRGNLAKIEFSLPPLPEQRRIADILDKADAIRRKRQEAVRLTEEFLPSLFAKMFGICGSKYPTAPLNDHLTFITSGSRGWAEHYVPVGKRFLRSLDVQMNRIGTDDVVFVNPPNGAEADRTRLKDGDVLVTITGSRIGRVAFVPDNFGEAYVSQHVSIIRLAASLRPRGAIHAMRLKKAEVV